MLVNLFLILSKSYEWSGALTFTLLFLYSVSNIETEDVSRVYDEDDEVSNKSFVQFCKTYSNLLIEQVTNITLMLLKNPAIY